MVADVRPTTTTNERLPLGDDFERSALTTDNGP